ncbi:4-hydroxybenzoate polyprenyltransferase [Methylophaga lonarensis MPL]|uniref:4-hydroxybenzoate octaprenyltransferase n=1 Tax=Methylophaga lonarensis MPL TaxID=1286106 RepID=M7P2G8_9GAMM|nr:4-hydroxybenzoate octaprenyltransferase [Methylophaga lonarensis]EMR13687.1 4-hydroxybenzoate polyprenyltransferase [Methylophaga lonarensis MPL]
MKQSTVMAYVQLMRLDRPIGILLLLWPTLTALWIAGQGQPDWHLVIIFSLGVLIMRSAGCVINDFADRNVDGLVERTRQRPLATGALSAKQALICFFALLVLALFLVLQLDWLTIQLSLVALLLAVIYPFMKRYTHLPQIVLGMAFGWAIPMAFAAQTGSVPAVAWLLFLANILWTTVYDTFYAMADRPDDLKVGVKSTAILFGEDDLTILKILQLSFLSVMLLVGFQLQMSLIFYLGLLIALLLFAYQQWIAEDRQPRQCVQAFLNNNWVGAVIFAAVVLHYLYQ